MDREAQVTSVKDRSQAVERRIAGFGKHTIEAFPVQFGLTRDCPDPTMGVGHIAESHEKHTRIFVFKAGVQIMSGFIRIPERLQQTLTIRRGRNRSLWHPKYSFQCFFALRTSLFWVRLSAAQS